MWYNMLVKFILLLICVLEFGFGCDPEYFQVCPRSTTVILGENISLACIVQPSVPLPVFYKNPDDEIRRPFLNDGNFTRISNSSVDFSMIMRGEEKHQGPWKCCFLKGIGEMCTPEIIVTIAIPLNRSDMTLTSFDEARHAGTMEEISCEIEKARPEPRATWYLDDIILRSSKMAKIEENKYVSKIKKKFQADDHQKNLSCEVGYQRIPDIKPVKKYVILNITYGPLFDETKFTSNEFKIKFRINPEPNSYSHFETISEAVEFGKMTCESLECSIPVKVNDSLLYDKEHFYFDISISNVNTTFTVDFRDHNTNPPNNKNGNKGKGEEVDEGPNLVAIIIVICVGCVIIVAAIAYIVYKRKRTTSQNLGIDNEGITEEDNSIQANKADENDVEFVQLRFNTEEAEKEETLEKPESDKIVKVM